MKFAIAALLTAAGILSTAGSAAADNAPIKLDDDLLLVEPEASNLRAGLAMTNRGTGGDVHGDAESRAFGFAAVARLAVGRRARAMEHHLEAQVGVRDPAMGPREAGNKLVPAPLEDLDCVEQIDEQSLDDAFRFERVEFRRAETEILFVDLRVVLAVQRR